MILTAVLIPPALLLLIIAMDRFEDRMFAAPVTPRHAGPRRRMRLLPQRRRPETGPAAEEIEQPLPEAA
ncbi:hypothetical protein [Streptomyces wuyuanensis]|uniref:Uncharacterized protein n=1 Tax=Streptomyces wuyuanensis TaxID=1196353 RepID=A0A1G9TPP5_9ACTN|nr:hypothetical protein [Streptomyces wuyuanensis]SDM49727.1 hypothetical protein SAMN05444921_10928 [Streptomyces wuyuanensis]